MADRFHSDKAALRGEPSYVWRAGQERRLRMICEAASMIEKGRVLVDGCGLGMYVEKLGAFSDRVHGLDIELDRVAEAGQRMDKLVCGEGEYLPYASESFDAVLSHEVIEHVNDDAAAAREIVRVLRSGGRLVLFCPNRWYPVETHGIYWRGRYLFGNIPLVNYLPDPLRNRLAPHVRAYTGRGLRKLFGGLPVRIVRHSVIFGGYDNLIARLGPLGKLIRGVLYLFENTPLQVFGLSHFLVAEKL
jgi:SAM-dependent methyltransferase